MKNLSAYSAFLPALSLWALIFLFFVPAKLTAMQIYSYRIVQVYPHDPGAFTQGLVFKDGVLYESTGLLGQSSLREVELTTGSLLKYTMLPADVFGEGIALFNHKIALLSWQQYKGFIYDRDSFSLINEFYYTTEGWGLTYDGERLIMSDGSATLQFLNPGTFEVEDTLKVTDSGTPVTGLNELEFIKGKIFANVWPTDRIVIISPQNGAVAGWINLKGILGDQSEYRRVDVLNGIAYDAAKDRLFITGKLWPKLFEIQLVPLR